MQYRSARTEGVPMGLGEDFKVSNHVERGLLSDREIPSYQMSKSKLASMLPSISHEVLSSNAKQTVYLRPEHIVALERLSYL